jgi:hypothetical protein
MGGIGTRRPVHIRMVVAESPTNTPSEETTSLGTTLWCVTATVVAPNASSEPKQETSGGTKQFKPGAKLYVIDSAPGADALWLAIGHHRKSRQFVKSEIAGTLIERPCLEEVSTPNVLTLARKHVAAGGKAPTKENAEAILRTMAATKP